MNNGTFVPEASSRNEVVLYFTYFTIVKLCIINLNSGCFQSHYTWFNYNIYKKRKNVSYLGREIAVESYYWLL